MKHESRPQRVTPAMKAEAARWNRRYAKLVAWLKMQQAELTGRKSRLGLRLP